MSFTIHEATKADAQQIAELHTKSWRASYRGSLSDDYLDNHAFQDRQAVWQKRFEVENLNQCILIAKDRESLAGFVCLFANYDENFGAYLDNLHVDPAYQGRGLGKVLMQEVAKWLLANTHNKTMYLWVFEANHSARKFYEALGGLSHEISNEPMPDGNRVSSVRYIWKDVEMLYQNK